VDVWKGGREVGREGWREGGRTYDNRRLGIVRRRSEHAQTHSDSLPTRHISYRYPDAAVVVGFGPQIPCVW